MSSPRATSEPGRSRGPHTRLTPLLALAEQAAFALTSLALQILLARSVTPEVFGGYAVAATFLLVAALAHQTCLIEPMIIFSAGRPPAEVAGYHRALVGAWSGWLSLGLGLLALLLVAVAAAFGAPAIARPLGALALGAPPVLSLWLLRRIAFARGRADLSLAATLLYATLTLGLAAAAFGFGQLGPVTAILACGAGAAVAAIALALHLGVRPGRAAAAPRRTGRRHLAYGAPALGAEAAAWALTNAPVLALPVWQGLAAAAELRLLGLLLMPLLQIGSVASLVLLRDMAASGRAAVPRHAVRALAAGALAYALAAVLFGPTLAPRLFGPGYAPGGALIALAGAGAALLVAAQPFIASLRARRRAGDVLAAHCAALATLALALPFAGPLGLPGVVLAQTLAAATLLAAAALRARRPGGAALAEWQPFGSEIEGPGAEVIR